ncbi:exo-alpha-sialidase [Bradyrhizobium jicamae]|uniref:sialidase family protein n=1 Tax=Bradyrhizobium jicamae TaxID=280332 RepID=UPI001BA83920|nr:exo-alpha-sialidase [Bradyrhizobium jicamae]MBR0755426.1 exo-alpha-sialidase [Bradyrhizobium jicamae]
MTDVIDIAADGVTRKVADDPDRFDAFIPSPCVQNHAANLMELANGDLACVWFGGTQEGMSDISVYFSRLARGAKQWSKAEKLSDDSSRSEQNPVLFPAPDGTLWLMWTAQLAGNQDTALIRRRLSHDHGKSWGPIETLFPETRGRGTFIRQPIVVLDNGDWLLPVFYCHSLPGKKWNGDEDTSAVKISSDQGATWRDVDVPGSRGCVHMCIARVSDGSLLAMYRSRWADHIYQSRSSDHGRSWSAPVATSLPNNNSSIQFTRLANGHLALVFNNSSAANATDRRLSLYDEIEDNLPPVLGGEAAKTDGRSAFWGAPRAPMTLAISTDDGRSWTRRDVEIGDGYCLTNNSRDQTNRELSYPSVKQTSDGALHMAFTYHRRAIKHVRVTEPWVARDGKA